MSTKEAVSDINAPVPPAGALTLVEPQLRAEFLNAVEHRRPQLERVAMNMMRCREDAEDIVQESVLKALRFLPRFRRDARLDTWLHAIVVNTARDWLRLRRQRAKTSLETESEEWDDTLVLDFPHPGDDPEESCSRHELLRLLHEEIRSLDPVYQRPIQLCDLDGRSYREAALMLKLSGPAMKARLFRGRRLLKSKLLRHSGSPVAFEPERPRVRRRKSEKRRSSQGAASLEKEREGLRSQPDTVSSN